MTTSRRSLPRALLAFLFASQCAAAAVVQGPIRLQSWTPAMGLPALAAHAVSPALSSSARTASLLLSAPVLPAAPQVSPLAAPLDAPLPAVQPAAPVSALGQVGSAAQDFTGAWTRGDALGAQEALGTHFDGLAHAAPADAGAELGAGVVQPAPAPIADVPFHGLRLPAAQFSEEGPGWMSSKLIAAMDATQDTMDLALLEVMHRDLVAAVLRAHARGVKVRIVIDSIHVYPEKPGQHRSDEIQQLLDAKVPLRILRGGDRFGLMHNKFAVLDGQLVWSGSANWSRAADNVHQENATYTNDAHRVSGFQEVWGWMWGLGKPFGEPAGRADGRTPPQDSQRPVRFHGEGFPAYAFAPGDGAEGWLLQAIKLSRRTLDIAMFSCTSGRIQSALLEARSRGVKVRIVFDKAQFRYLPPMMWFVDNGFDVLLGEGFRPGKSAMHHKFVVFDGELVQNGSYNWTDNAKFNNFENVQFWDDPALVAKYLAGYERLRARSSPITDEDIAANKATAAERAKEEKEGVAPVEKTGDGRLTRWSAPLWGSRRLALSPFRRAPGAALLG
ncbi:MAG: phospholipase D-like domain-containing protein [Elusimicrobia bacterium]|nr:phospholipase D-like domain-containing protein [Elusimicrobiota bacterium]